MFKEIKDDRQLCQTIYEIDLDWIYLHILQERARAKTKVGNSDELKNILKAASVIYTDALEVLDDSEYKLELFLLLVIFKDQNDKNLVRWQRELPVDLSDASENLMKIESWFDAGEDSEGELLPSVRALLKETENER